MVSSMTKQSSSWTGRAIWFLFSVLTLFSLIIGMISYSMSTKNPWIKILRRKLNDNVEESEEETDDSSDSSMMSLLKYYEEEHEEVRVTKDIQESHTIIEYLYYRYVILIHKLMQSLSLSLSLASFWCHIRNLHNFMSHFLDYTLWMGETRSRISHIRRYGTYHWKTIWRNDSIRISFHAYLCYE